MKKFIKALSLILSVCIVFSGALIGVYSFSENDGFVRDTVNYGSYPQTRIIDDSVTAALDSLGENAEWTAYNYYTGNGTNGSQTLNTSLASYTDIIYGGAKYRGVKINKYRPERTYDGLYKGEEDPRYYNEDRANQYKNGYYKNSTYWFRFEPITWWILDSNTGYAVSTLSLDTQPVSNTYITSPIEFDDSDLYDWLNSEFKTTAFTAAQSEFLIGNISLLSKDDCENTAYGFEAIDESTSRLCGPTDYAVSLGMPNDIRYLEWNWGSYYSVNASQWHTSTIVFRNNQYFNNYRVNNRGRTDLLDSSYQVAGIRPCIYLDLSSDNNLLGKNTITYYYNPDNTAVYSELHATGESITEYIPDEIEGYTFNNWDAEVPENMPGYDMYLFADWTIHNNKVTFNANGGKFKSNNSDIIELNLDYGSSITQEYPSKQGYVFTGWDNNVPSSMPDNALEFNAKWAPATDTPYKVIIHKENADNADYSTEEISLQGTTEDWVTYNHEEIEHFVYLDDISSETVQINPEGTSEIHLYYKRTTHNVVFNFNDDVNSDIITTYKYGQKIIIPKESTRTGYVTDGWKDTQGNPPSATCRGADTYILNWAKGKYQITYNTDGGNYINPQVYEYQAEVTAPENPVKTGYTFIGWDREFPEKMPAENLEYTAQWSKNKYKLTFKTGDTIISQTDVYYDDAITAPPAPVKEGYSFSWGEFPQTMPAKDLTVEGAFTVNTYNLILDIYGKRTSVPFEYGAAVSVNDPVKSGYYFTGWSPALPETMPASDFTATAQFKIIPVLKIAGFTSSRDVKWRTTITFHADYNGSPDAKIIWIVNGNDVPDNGSRTYTASELRSDLTIDCRVIDGDKTINSKDGKETVKPNTSFFGKIIWFFLNIFNKNALIIDQR